MLVCADDPLDAMCLALHRIPCTGETVVVIDDRTAQRASRAFVVKDVRHSAHITKSGGKKLATALIVVEPI